MNHRSRFLPVLLALAACLAGLPGGIGAQAPPSAARDTIPDQVRPSLGPDGEVWGILGASVGVSELSGSVAPTIRGQLMLQLVPRVRIGAEAVHIPGGVRTSPSEAGDSTDLHLTYAGIRTELLLPDPLGGWTMGLLAGTGTARLRSSLLGSDIVSSNVAILEPFISRSIPAPGPLHARIDAGWRLPLRPSPSSGIPLSDLRGPIAAFTLELRKLP